MPNDPPSPDAPAAGSESDARLAAVEAQLALVQDLGGAFPFAWDAESGIITASDGFRHLFGLEDGQAITPDLLAARLHPDDRGRVLADRVRLLTVGGDFESEFRICLPGGHLRWLLACGYAVVGGDGKPTGLVGVHRDITRKKEAERALVESEARFHAMVNAIDPMVWSTRPDGYHDYYNKRWYAFTGMPQGSTDGDGWNDLFHADDRERAFNVWRSCLASGAPYRIEYRLRHHSGEYRWVIGRARPAIGADGEITRWYGTCTDIHDLKEAEDARELIARELSHRIKNIFALTSGLITLSARGRPEIRAYSDGLRGRIAALAQAHEYVRPHGPDSVGPERQDLAGLIASLLAPYRNGDDRRVRISGGDFEIGPISATNLALLLHELATNAVKYGALSTPAGQLEVECTVVDGQVGLIWRERGGPPVAGPPVHQGFGTVLSRKVASVQLDATIEELWDPEGLTVSVTMARTRLHR